MSPEVSEAAPVSLRLMIPARVAAISRATEEADAWLESRGAPATHRMLVALALDEWVTNCVKYAYDDPDGHEVEVVLTLEGTLLTILIVDDGRPFDPLEVETPDLATDLEDRKLGGLGIHLLRSLADRMEYERAEGQNRLVLAKAL